MTFGAIPDISPLRMHPPSAFATSLFSGLDTCKINKSTQQNHPKTARPDPTSERLKLVSTDLLGPVTPKAIGGAHLRGKVHGSSHQAEGRILR